MPCKIVLSDKTVCNSPAFEWIFRGGIAAVGAVVCQDHVEAIRGEKPHWKIEMVVPIRKMPLWSFLD